MVLLCMVKELRGRVIFILKIGDYCERTKFCIRPWFSMVPNLPQPMKYPVMSSSQIQIRDKAKKNPSVESQDKVHFAGCIVVDLTEIKSIGTLVVDDH